MKAVVLSLLRQYLQHEVLFNEGINFSFKHNVQFCSILLTLFIPNTVIIFLKSSCNVLSYIVAHLFYVHVLACSFLFLFFLMLRMDKINDNHTFIRYAFC